MEIRVWFWHPTLGKSFQINPLPHFAHTLITLHLLHFFQLWLKGTRCRLRRNKNEVIIRYLLSACRKHILSRGIINEGCIYNLWNSQFCPLSNFWLGTVWVSEGRHVCSTWQQGEKKASFFGFAVDTNSWKTKHFKEDFDYVIQTSLVYNKSHFFLSTVAIKSKIFICVDFMKTNIFNKHSTLFLKGKSSFFPFPARVRCET